MSVGAGLLCWTCADPTAVIRLGRKNDVSEVTQAAGKTMASKPYLTSQIYTFSPTYSSTWMQAFFLGHDSRLYLYFAINAAFPESPFPQHTFTGPSSLSVWRQYKTFMTLVFTCFSPGTSEVPRTGIFSYYSSSCPWINSSCLMHRRAGNLHRVNLCTQGSRLANVYAMKCLWVNPASAMEEADVPERQEMEKGGACVHIHTCSCSWKTGGLELLEGRL